MYTDLNEEDSMPDGSRVAVQGIFAQWNVVNIKEDENLILYY